MVFSNAVFLFLFLPITTLVYYGLLRRSLSARNVWLLLVSLGFYAWGEPVYVFIMLLSICTNFFLAKAVAGKNGTSQGKWIVAVACVFNLGILFAFKYLPWILGDILHVQSGLSRIALPIGISFYTFQSLSYVIDVYRGTEEPQHSVLDAGLYISFFPQLIAGPIVRYGTVSAQIRGRTHTFAKFSDGVQRFVVGLTKKILIANSLAPLAEFAYSAEQLSVLLAWLGSLGFMVQLYFDFSGYSDMAIGLGKMFGFEFNENFNYPYISKSISEYWRRWHISLGEWFRDYLYHPVSATLGRHIRKSLKPLVGNKTAVKAEYVSSIFAVWVFTGIWHGANWTFLVWGMMNFVVIMIETFAPQGKSTPVRNVLRVLRTWFIILMFKTMFNAHSLSHALSYYASLFHLNNNAIADANGLYYLGQYRFLLLVGILFSLPIVNLAEAFCKRKSERLGVWSVRAKKITLILLFALDVCYAIGGSYNPFLYFNF